MQFIGGGMFDANSWPPLPATLRVDDRTSPVTQSLPETFLSPVNEWYRWKPRPRDDSHIHVLVTLDPANYPLGIKGLLTYGDIPVVWTNNAVQDGLLEYGPRRQDFYESDAERAD
jgi:uncharacterized protein